MALVTIVIGAIPMHADFAPFAVRTIAPDVRVRSAPSARSSANILGHSAPGTLWYVMEIRKGLDDKGRARDWYRVSYTPVDDRQERYIASWVVTAEQVVAATNAPAPSESRLPWWHRPGFVIAVCGVIAALIALLSALAQHRVTARAGRNMAEAARLQLEAERTHLETARAAQQAALLAANANTVSTSARPGASKAPAQVLNFPRATVRGNVRDRLGIPQRTFSRERSVQ